MESEAATGDACPRVALAPGTAIKASSTKAFFRSALSFRSARGCHAAVSFSRMSISGVKK